MNQLFIIGFLWLSLLISSLSQGAETHPEPPPASTQSHFLTKKNNTYFSKTPSITRLTECVDFFSNFTPTEMLIVVDWDNTMSKINGSSLPLREGQTTRQTIKNLVDRGIPLIILTSRLAGTNIFIKEGGTNKIEPNSFNAMFSSVANMMTALNISLPSVFKENTYFSRYPPSELRFGYYPSPTHPDYYTLIYKNVVFAGAPNQSIKGPGLKDLIDRGLFIHQPKIIFFIDNDIDHVESVLSAFQSREESVVGLFYPQSEEEIKNQSSLLTP